MVGGFSQSLAAKSKFGKDPSETAGRCVLPGGEETEEDEGETAESVASHLKRLPVS